MLCATVRPRTDNPGGNLYALDSATGEPGWVFNAKGALTSPAISDGTIYFGSSRGFAYAPDSSTGRQKWGHRLGSVPDYPVVSGGPVYFAARDGNLYALAAETGERVLKFGAPGKLGSAFADGIIYYGGRARDFHAADARAARER